MAEFGPDLAYEDDSPSFDVAASAAAAAPPFARGGPLAHDASPVFQTESFAHPPTAPQMRREPERLERVPV